MAKIKIRRPSRRLRLLPVTMLVAFLTLGIKLGEVMHDTKAVFSSLLNTASAEAVPEPKKEEEKAKEPAVEEKPAADAKAEAKPEAKTETKEGEKPAGEAKEELDEMQENKKKREYSQIEVDLLQSLAQRRQELDSWAKQVQLKENMLIATEQRINDKIDGLQKMKKEIEDLLALYNEQEDTKIRSLVKIYEKMKPKDAARIFEELDMPVLLTVVDRMSESRVSPILAAMTPGKAKDLTVQLAEQRKLQKPRASGAGNAAADAGAAADSAAAPNGGNAANASPPAGSENGGTTTPATNPAENAPEGKQ